MTKPINRRALLQFALAFGVAAQPAFTLVTFVERNIVRRSERLDGYALKMVLGRSLQRLSGESEKSLLCLAGRDNGL